MYTRVYTTSLGTHLGIHHPLPGMSVYSVSWLLAEQRALGSVLRLIRRDEAQGAFLLPKV